MSAGTQDALLHSQTEVLHFGRPYIAEELQFETLKVEWKHATVLFSNPTA